MAIRFYSKSETYSEFSNFAGFPIEIDGEVWPSVEHYYQASKFADPEMRDKIRLAPKPVIAKKLAQKYSGRMRADWTTLRDDVMERALRDKLARHRTIRELLMTTGEEELIETAPDRYWGIGRDGAGENRLGRLWMKLREELKAIEA
ncbi:MAG TPA: NADAR family protein [Bauldia sp.]|nr:NADAR family protein [Bauldia sp.]